MVVTYSIDDTEYTLNQLRAKNMGDNILVTVDHGDWVLLSKSEFQALLSQNIKDKALLSILKEKNILITANNFVSIGEKYAKKYVHLFHGASLHIVIPTLRCNHNCIYCHSEAKPLGAEGFDMDEKTAEKTVDFIFQSPSESIRIEFQGGEPLIKFNLVKHIVEYAKKLNETHKKDLSFALVSNLTLMTEDILDYIAEEEIGLCTSIDGADFIHNDNREDYDLTVSWLDRIRKKQDIYAMAVVTKQSLDFHKEIVDEYVKRDFDMVWLKPVNNMGYASRNWSQIGFTSEEFLKFWGKAMDYIVSLNKSGTKIKENSALIILNKIMGRPVNFTDLESPCGAIITQLSYLPNGNIHTCDEGKLFEIFKIGTVDENYSDVVTSDQSLEMINLSINDSLKCDNCVYKPYCGVCPVASYAETGNALTKIPCNRCKIWEGMFDYVFKKLTSDDEYREVFFSWLERS